MRASLLRTPAAAALLSALLPGAGHAVLGRRRTAALTLGAFAVSVLAACLAASNQLALTGMAPVDLPAGLLWIAASAWLFAVCDACCLAAGISDSPTEGRTVNPEGLTARWEAESPTEGRRVNPRAAFALNLATRGLGYVYVDRPVLGGLAIVGLGALATFGGCRFDPTLFALQAVLAVHAWQIASRPESQAPPRRLRGALILAAVVALGWGAGQSVLQLAGSSRPGQAAWEPPRPVSAGRTVVLSGTGLGFRLPAPDWRLDTHADSPLACLVCPRARVLVFRSSGPDGLGLDGYLVELAGHLATQYGPVQLRGQRMLPSPAGPVREVSFEWTRDGVPEASHVYLLALGDQVYTFLVTAPARPGPGVRDELERLVGSLRLLQ